MPSGVKGPHLQQPRGRVTAAPSTRISPSTRPLGLPAPPPPCLPSYPCLGRLRAGWGPKTRTAAASYALAACSSESNQPRCSRCPPVYAYTYTYLHTQGYTTRIVLRICLRHLRVCRLQSPPGRERPGRRKKRRGISVSSFLSCACPLCLPRSRHPRPRPPFHLPFQPRRWTVLARPRP